MCYLARKLRLLFRRRVPTRKVGWDLLPFDFRVDWYNLVERPLEEAGFSARLPQSVAPSNNRLYTEKVRRDI